MRILVTGASGGLGTAVVEQLAGEGAEVLAVARALKAADPRITQLAGDLTVPEDAARIASQAGQIDALVHLVGGFAPGSGVGTLRRMISMNLEAAVNIAEAVKGGMLERGRGSIVAVGARAGVEPVAGLGAYGASKAALLHYIRTLALELRDSGVRVNAVLPSTIDTAANREAMPKADSSRWVEPASIAKVVSWLVSDAAADVSGALVPVYGRA